MRVPGNAANLGAGSIRDIPAGIDLPTFHPCAYILFSIYTILMETKVFQSGNSKAIRLPKDLELPCGPVSIRREGRKLIIEELTDHGWPAGFFESIRISRKDFGREIPEYSEKSL